LIVTAMPRSTDRRPASRRIPSTRAWRRSAPVRRGLFPRAPGEQQPPALCGQHVAVGSDVRATGWPPLRAAARDVEPGTERLKPNREGGAQPRRRTSEPTATCCPQSAGGCCSPGARGKSPRRTGSRSSPRAVLGSAGWQDDGLSIWGIAVTIKREPSGERRGVARAGSDHSSVACPRASRASSLAQRIGTSDSTLVARERR